MSNTEETTQHCTHITIKCIEPFYPNDLKLISAIENLFSVSGGAFSDSFEKPSQETIQLAVRYLTNKYLKP